MIFMPPRHGKSMLTSIYAPAWAIASFPRMRIILASYQGGLPAGWTAASKELLVEHGEDLYGSPVVSPLSRARSTWETTMGGYMWPKGIGGGITGQGAELLIIDDPVKDQEAAMSETIRNKAWDWWVSTARPRLQPGAGVIVIMTRWHEDDLAGRLLKQDAEGEGEDWTVLNYPALAEPPRGADGRTAQTDGIVDDLGRRTGEALWPEMYDRAYLEKTRKVSSTYWFTAMYQQRPGPSEGAILKRDWFWNNLYEPFKPPALKEVCQSWDMAFTKGTGNSWVVGQVWGTDLAERYLLAEIRARLDFTETLVAVDALTKYVQAQGWARAGQHRIFVEDKANGPAVINVLKRKISGIVAVTPQGSKEARVHSISPQVESGNVHLPRGVIPAPPPTKEVSWEPSRTDDFIEEVSNFPLSAFDDRVDAMSQALDRMAKSGARVGKLRSGSYSSTRG